MVDFATKEVTWLTPMGGGGGAYHAVVNTAVKPGWGLISVFGPFYPTVPTYWDQYSVYLSELTTRTNPPPRVWRVAQTHTVRKTASDDPYAKMNRKGTKIWFGSAWGQSYSDGAQYDVYQIDLPANWYSDLMSFNIITSSLPSGTGGSAYSQTLQASGGTIPYTWSITSGSLPSGLSLNSSNGIISGTPTSAGTYTFTVQLRDSTNQTLTKVLSITINAPDTTPPVLSGIQAASITSNSAAISWTTNEVSDSQVEYGLTSSYGSQTTLNTSMTASHSVYLSGLSALTTYHYRVKSRDASNNLAVSSDHTFTTLSSTDIYPPVRFSGSPTGTLTMGTTQTAISLYTDESATCRYSTTANTSYANMTNTMSTGSGGGYSATVSGLQNGHSYSYYVRCQDTIGNTNIDDYTITFSVANSGDTTPPAAPSGVTVN
jgi:hypothetical protein